MLDKPLYELGITGIFTKTLDIAMINGQIDIAVHSMKDVPTRLPKGMVQAAVLERATEKDILVFKNNTDFLGGLGTIATGSLRRQAQWLHRYEHHKVVDLRGNVQTRLQKLNDNTWNGAIFAAAGLERINLLPENHIDLDWMIPAPAQGAMVVVAMEKDYETVAAVAKLNHKPSEICTRIERDFLRKLEGGCSAPIGAFAQIIGNEIRFEGVLCSVDGKDKIQMERVCNLDDHLNFGFECGSEVLQNGGQDIMVEIRNILK